MPVPHPDLASNRLLTAAIFDDPGVDACFSDGPLIANMIRFEIALAEVQAQIGLVPEASAKAIAAAATAETIDPGRLISGVCKAGVPVPALLDDLRAQVPEPHKDWIHWGATSQDVVDSALCLAMADALHHIERKLVRLIDLLEAACTSHAALPMLARTRGQLATPITLGLRLAQWAQPLIALEAEAPAIRARGLRVQFGGAAGSASVVAPHGAVIAQGLATKLGLSPSAPWHTDRSGLQALGAWLGRVLSALGKIGGDIAISSRGEVAELFAGSGGGSSTMPHKSNPVKAEALQSSAILGQGMISTLSFAATHSEERDGVHWPVEWYTLPKIFSVTGAALGHAIALLEDLRPQPAAMAHRIAANPEVMAEAALFALARNIGRSEAQKIVAQALASEDPLAVALAKLSPVTRDWEAVLSLDASTAAAAEVAKDIFAARVRPQT